LTNKQRQTTTVITTTTTTYKILDDSSADEYELIMHPMEEQLTVDVPLRVSEEPPQSNVSYVMIGSQTESSMSPITTDDDAQRSDGARSPEERTIREAGELSRLARREWQPPVAMQARDTLQVGGGVELMESYGALGFWTKKP
jgi:hypothetical protein